jgi:hypothetical protein
MNILKLLKSQAINVVEWYYSRKYLFKQKKAESFVSNSFTDSPEIKMEKLKIQRVLPFSELVAIWTYKDESWNYIKNLTEYRSQMKAGNTISYTDNPCHGYPDKYLVRHDYGDILVDTLPINDNWLCFFLNDLHLEQYVLSFDIELASDFTEVQVAFRYKDLGNRYRFMIRNNSEAVFECVYQGEFYHSLRSIPYRLDHGAKSRVTVVVLKNCFQFMIDQCCVFTIKEKKSLVDGTDLGIILWNKNDTTPIRCQISNLSLMVVTEDGNRA